MEVVDEEDEEDEEGQRHVRIVKDYQREHRG